MLSKKQATKLRAEIDKIAAASHRYSQYLALFQPKRLASSHLQWLLTQVEDNRKIYSMEIEEYAEMLREECED